jgi:uncharacterized membrane protein YdjX (TVP38/TMEM64 family)
MVPGERPPPYTARVSTADRPVPTMDPDHAQASGPDPDRSSHLERAHGWVLDHWPTSRRRQVAVVAIGIALVLIAIPWIVAVFDEALAIAANLDLLAYAGMMIVCWVGAGGALVPIPGARPLSWVLVVQQGAVLDPLLVALAAALAMGLGQASYFLATRAGNRRLHRRHRGRHQAAEDTRPDSPGTTDAAARAGAAVDADGSKATGSSRGLVGWARRLMARAKDTVARLMTRHPQRTIFLVSVVPSPLTTFGTVAAADERVEFRSFFVASLAGFLVMTTALVVAGKGILAALGISAG